MSGSDTDTHQDFGASALTITETEILSVQSPQSSSVQNVSTEEYQTMKRIIDNEFFHYLPEKSFANTIVALCVKCQPQVVEIKGYKSTTSNFISHLKRRHGEETVKEYKEYISSKKLRKTSPTRTIGGTVSGYDSQDAFDEDIAKFVIHSMVPLRTVENPYFISLFDKLKISQQGVKIMSRRSLNRRINSF